MARIKTLDKIDCDGETFSIIEGDILTPCGYRPINTLDEGDHIIDEKGRARKVKGVKHSFLLDKKAIRVKDAIFTKDMLFLLDEDAYGSFDLDECFKAVFNDVRTSTALGHFDRVGKQVYDLNVITTYSNGIHLVAEEVDLPMATSIYTVIVDGARWCNVNGMTVACAKEIRGFRVKED